MMYILNFTPEILSVLEIEHFHVVTGVKIELHVIENVCQWRDCSRLFT
jgi:hypothetical protein